MVVAHATPRPRRRRPAADLSRGPGADARQGRAGGGPPRRRPCATISSSRPATSAAPMMVRARTPSTPARCHSQDGMRRPGLPRAGTPASRPARARGRAAEPAAAGTARPAGPPRRRPSARAPREPGPRAPGRTGRSGAPGCRRASSRSTGCAGLNPDGSSRAPSSSGSVATQPGGARTPGRRGDRGRGLPRVPGPAAHRPGTGPPVTGPPVTGPPVTRSVPGPSGVSEVRQIAPASSTRNAGSPRAAPVHGQHAADVDRERRQPAALDVLAVAGHPATALRRQPRTAGWWAPALTPGQTRSPQRSSLPGRDARRIADDHVSPAPRPSPMRAPTADHAGADLRARRPR